MWLSQSSAVREKAYIRCSHKLERVKRFSPRMTLAVAVACLLAFALLDQLLSLITRDASLLSFEEHTIPSGTYGVTGWKPKVRYVNRIDIVKSVDSARKTQERLVSALPFGPRVEAVLLSHAGVGEVRMFFERQSYCLDTMGSDIGGKPGVFPCHHKGGTQAWVFTEQGTLASVRASWGCIGTSEDGELRLVDCELGPPRLLTWDWKSSGQLVVGGAAVGDRTAKYAVNCLTVESDSGLKLSLRPCARYFARVSPYDSLQRWIHVKPEMQSDVAATKVYDFNHVVSDAIGTRRNVVDIRSPDCKRLISQIRSDYGIDNHGWFRGMRRELKQLGPTSIVICFVDEEWWALLRTLHSVLDRTPVVFVKEIILVDDGSSAPHLGLPLESYVKALPEKPKVTILRTGARIGLIRARLLGASAASADVLTFLDSHVEVAEGWLEPLLMRLLHKPNAIVTPQIVVTSQDKIEFQSYAPPDNTAYGMFNWDLVFHWAYVRAEVPPGPPRARDTDPVQSPAMAGGIYAVQKGYFESIGAYDQSMEGWGAENVEMSMRVWMCGGSIELIPCSIVSHIFRQKNPTKFPGTNIQRVLMHNRKRTVDVWFDHPYRELFYRLHPNARSIDRGNISSRVELRERLRCNNFDWFAKNLMPNVFAPLPRNLQDRGQLQIVGWGTAAAAQGKRGIKARCLSLKHTIPEMNPCPCEPRAVDCDDGRDANSNFFLTSTGELRGTDWPRIKWCLMDKIDAAGKLTIDTCKTSLRDTRRQQWSLEPTRGTGDYALLRHKKSGLCLTAMLEKDGKESVKLEACDYLSSLQRVVFRTTYGGRYSGIREFSVDTDARTAALSLPDRDKGLISDPPNAGESAVSTSARMRTISVVLPCASESSFMLATVRSIYENTPADVLAEVIVIDDGSDVPLKTIWPSDDTDPSGVEGVPASGFDLNPETGLWGKIRSKVRFFRNEHTLGLMTSRTRGAYAATGDVIALFDCHVKPDKSWWRSVLTEISENYRRVVVPTITNLDVNTWTEVGSRLPPGRGMSSCYFTWDAEFKWTTNRFWKPGQKRWVPMMSGGLLAMSRKWWGELGGYDDKMMGWGGENIEQSLRIWLCGGEIVSLDDSYVAHMWRDGSDPKTRRHYKNVGDPLRNRWRAVSAWLGDFKAKTLTFPDFGRFRHQSQPENLREYQNLKARLKCRRFKWYIDRFAYVFHNAAVMPKTVFQLESQRAPGMCLERTGSVLGHAKIASGPLGLAPCNGEERLQLFHRSNQDTSGECCSGLRGYDSDQCIRHNGIFASESETIDTSVCAIDGSNPSQAANLDHEGRIILGSHPHVCLQAVLSSPGSAIKVDGIAAIHKWKLMAVPCQQTAGNSASRSKISPKWKVLSERQTLERKIYDRQKLLEIISS